MGLTKTDTCNKTLTKFTNLTGWQNSIWPADTQHEVKSEWDAEKWSDGIRMRSPIVERNYISMKYIQQHSPQTLWKF